MARRLAWGLGIGLCLLAGSVRAEANGVVIVLFTAGPANTFHWGRWSEAVVRVRNESAQIQDGRLVVDFPSRHENLQSLFTRPVKLPPHSQMEVTMPVCFPPVTAMPPGQGRGFPVRVCFQHDHATLAQETFFSLPATEERVSALWCDTRGAVLGFHLNQELRGVSTNAFNGRKPKDDPGAAVPVAGGRLRKDCCIELSTSENLPHWGGGYHSYDVVVLSGLEREGLDALQTEALLNWVRRGGRLLVIAREGLMRSISPDLAARLPLWPSERYEVSRLPEMESLYGDLGIGDGIFVSDGPRAPADILLGDSDQPILLRRRLELGSVYFLTLDLDRRAAIPAPGIIRLLQGTIEIMSEDSTVPPLYAAPHARGLLEQLIAVRIVSRGKMAIWLLGYFVIVTASLVGARFTRKPEWGYAGVALVAVAAFLLLQRASRGEPRSASGQVERARVYLAETANGGRAARITGLEGFFPESARDLRLFPLSFESFLSVPSGLGGERPEAIEFQTRDLSGIGSWRMAPRVMRAVGLDAPVSLKDAALSYEGRLTREGLRLQVRSGVPWKLVHSFCKWNRFVVPLPDLAPGSSETLETWKWRSDWGRYQSGNVQSGRALACRLLRQAVFTDIPRAWGLGGDFQRMIRAIQGREAVGIALGGFTDESPPLFQEEGRKDASATLGLWLAVGGPSRLSADEEYWLPPGLAGFRLVGKEGRMSHLGEGHFGGRSEDVFTIQFTLPECLRGSEAREVLFQGKFESLYFTPQALVGIGDADHEPRDWKPMAWSSSMRFPEDAIALGTGRDVLWLRVRVSRVEGARPPPMDGTGALNRTWSLRDVDVSVRGRKK